MSSSASKSSSRKRPEAGDKRRPEKGSGDKRRSSSSATKPGATGQILHGDREEARRRRKEHQRKILEELQKQRPVSKTQTSNFLCELKHWSALPDVPLNAKFVKMMLEPKRFSAYRPTSIENNYKPIMHTEPDLGVPIDMIDPKMYLAPKNPPPLALEDQKLIDGAINLQKQGGMDPASNTRQIRGTKKGKTKNIAEPWLRQTMYIANDLYDDVNKFSRMTTIVGRKNEQIQEEGRKLREQTQEQYLDLVDKYFTEANSGSTPVHPTKKNMKPLMVCPVFPDFNRWKCAEGFCRVSFEDAMTLKNDLNEKDDAPYEHGKPRKIRRLDGSVIRDVNARQVHDHGAEEVTGSLLIRRSKCNGKALNETSSDLKWLREYHIPKMSQLDGHYVFMLDEKNNVCTYVTVDSGLALRRLKKASRRDFAADAKLTRHPLDPLKVEDKKEENARHFEPGADEVPPEEEGADDGIVGDSKEIEDLENIEEEKNDKTSDESDDELKEEAKASTKTYGLKGRAKDNDSKGKEESSNSDDDSSSSSDGSDSSSSDDEEEKKKKRKKK